MDRLALAFSELDAVNRNQKLTAEQPRDRKAPAASASHSWPTTSATCDLQSRLFYRVRIRLAESRLRHRSALRTLDVDPGRLAACSCEDPVAGGGEPDDLAVWLG